MGRFFAQVFKKEGYRVVISDLHTPLSNKKLVQLSDVVMISVPIHRTQKVIREIIPYTRRGQLLTDVTSLKVLPLKEMIRGKADVIGLHPMFRPTPAGLKNQTVVMCVGRAARKMVATFENIFTKNGAAVIKMKPKQHDHLMSIIQVLVHFHTIVLGHTMRRLGVPVRETLKTASPMYRLEMDMIGRMFLQDPLLYGPIEMLNPESKKVIQALLKETAKLSKIVLKKDLAAFTKFFKQTAEFLGNFKEEAFEEINKLVAHL